MAALRLLRCALPQMKAIRGCRRAQSVGGPALQKPQPGCGASAHAVLLAKTWLQHPTVTKIMTEYD
jgi:hypothetical protein